MITPIIFNPIENNPYFWWNGLEIPLQLKYLFEQVMRHEKTIEELVEAVNKFNEEFEQTIEQEVVDKINEMYESGQLATIIGQAIANSMIGKNGDFDLSHMGYVLHLAHTYGRSELPAEDDSSLTVDEELYSALQGNCVFEINGNLYWACLYICQNGGSFEHNNACRIYVYTINQDGSLSYITDKEFAVIGHGNSMTYLDGYLYICPNSYEGTGGGTTTDVHRIAFDGSTLGGTLDPDTQTYRAETKTPTGNPWVINPGYTDYITAYDGHLYFCDSYMNVYSYDWDSNIALPIYGHINGVEGNPGADGLSMTEDYIYFGASGYRIKRYNKKLQYVDWVYQLPVKPSNKAFKLGEVEGFTVLNGVLYLAGFYNLSGVHTKYNTYSITHFYRQNLATNNIKIPNFINWSNGSKQNQATFTISGDIPSDRQNPRNDYFTCPCVEVALDFIETNEYIQRGVVTVRQYRNMAPICVRTTKPVTIKGTEYHNDTGNIASIGHIYALACPWLNIETIAIDNRLPSDIGVSNVLDNDIFINGGTLIANNVVFPAGLITNQESVNIAIKNYRGVLNCSTSEDYSQTPSGWEDARETNGVSNPHFTAGSLAIRNINGTVTAN